MPSVQATLRERACPTYLLVRRIKKRPCSSCSDGSRPVLLLPREIAVWFRLKGRLQPVSSTATANWHTNRVTQVPRASANRTRRSTRFMSVYVVGLIAPLRHGHRGLARDRTRASLLILCTCTHSTCSRSGLPEGTPGTLTAGEQRGDSKRGKVTKIDVG